MTTESAYRLSVVGTAGSGKTTLARQIAGQIVNLQSPQAVRAWAAALEVTG